jgi:DNA-directed RNA polymerase subunit K/omega
MDQIVGQALATFRRLDAARRARQLEKESPPLAVAAE